MGEGDAMQKTLERDLVKAALNGSSRAFDALLRASRPKMMAVARLILLNADDAEDAVQAAALNAYQYLSSLRAESSFHAWLMSIAINQARLRRRQIRRTRLLALENVQESAPQLRDVAAGPEAGFAAQELKALLHLEARRLPEKLQQVMLMYFDDVSMADASQRLGLSLSATKARLFRARVELFSRMRAVLA
jgi:RNA polymerase sigma-70 factor (ECF subfamily)